MKAPDCKSLLHPGRLVTTLPEVHAPIAALGLCIAGLAFPVTVAQGRLGNDMAMKTIAFLLSAISVIARSALAQPVEPQFLHNFTFAGPPLAPLAQGTDGNFYGTTQSGGNLGRGTIFRVTPTGMVTILASFGISGGYSPSIAALIPDTQGNFYGTTEHGGPDRQGTLFRMTSDGVVTDLVNFGGSNGSSSRGLTMDSQGNLYGTTVTSDAGDGTVFKFAADGTFSTLARFPNNYGSYPAALTIGRDGNLYGGTYNGLYGNGSVYRVTLDGEFTTLAALEGRSSGYSTALTEGRDGNFYGTTMNGGTAGSGTAFRVTPEGVVTTLVNFDRTNGALPTGPLALGRDGNLYGTTVYGGIFEGTVFRMTPGGTLTTLAHFVSRATGVRPYGGVVFGRDGDLYGTTATGGSGDSGTIFRVDLPPDTDGDGVLDSEDECGQTAVGAKVNAQGCSIGQLAPCAGPAEGFQWKNPGEYRLAVAREVARFVSEGLLTLEDAEEILATAIHSDCGKRTKPRR